jgi:hypothetical protein
MKSLTKDETWRRSKALEGAEHSGAIMLSVAQQVKDRKPIVIDDDGFAVNEARL